MTVAGRRLESRRLAEARSQKGFLTIVGIQKKTSGSSGASSCFLLLASGFWLLASGF